MIKIFGINIVTDTELSAYGLKQQLEQSDRSKFVLAYREDRFRDATRESAKLTKLLHEEQERYRKLNERFEELNRTSQDAKLLVDTITRIAGR